MAVFRKKEADERKNLVEKIKTEGGMVKGQDPLRMADANDKMVVEDIAKRNKGAKKEEPKPQAFMPGAVKKPTVRTVQPGPRGGSRLADDYDKRNVTEQDGGKKEAGPKDLEEEVQKRGPAPPFPKKQD